MVIEYMVSCLLSYMLVPCLLQQTPSVLFPLTTLVEHVSESFRTLGLDSCWLEFHWLCRKLFHYISEYWSCRSLWSLALCFVSYVWSTARPQLHLRNALHSCLLRFVHLMSSGRPRPTLRTPAMRGSQCFGFSLFEHLLHCNSCCAL